jgi:L-ascorbate metabolism protein UlaG (beta-lactamase superfamily)
MKDDSSVVEIALPALDGSVDISRGSILFIGTATVLLRYAGFTVLTDPNFLHQGESVHLGYGLRSRRLTEPAIPFESLPPFDMVLLSHLHEDHFDRRVEGLLARTTPIITTPKAANALTEKGFQCTTGLSTWQVASFARNGTQLRIASMPGRHGPWLLSGLLPPVMGSILEFTRSNEVLLRLYVSGDTLLFDQLAEIKQRYVDIDQALVHLGGTRVLGVLVTMDGAQGVGLLKLLTPKVAIPIHYDDYTVFKSPLADFQREVQRATLDTEVRYLRHGETYEFNVPHRKRSVCNT